jgi:hypothetical protein
MTANGLNRRLWTKARRLSMPDRLLVVEAIGWLCVARLSIRLLPFVWIGRHIGRWHPPAAATHDDPRTKAIAARITWAIDRGGRVLPLRFVCLPRALAAWQMLKLRGIPGRLHFGAVRTGEGPLQSHAWLDAGGVEVTGYPIAREYVEIGFYQRDQA